MNKQLISSTFILVLFVSILSGQTEYLPKKVYKMNLMKTDLQHNKPSLSWPTMI